MRGAGTIVVGVLAITALQRMVKPDVVARVFGVFFALVLAAISLVHFPHRCWSAASDFHPRCS